MAISSASGFSIGSSDAIDDRLVLTKAQMKSANDNVFPDVYMCVCSDDGNIYTYNKSNEVDETTGKFRKFESGGVKTVDGNSPDANGNVTSAFGDYTNDLGTENTTDTWMPVMNQGKMQHRVIPTNLATKDYCIPKYAETKMVSLGFTSGSTVDVADFLDKIRTTYGEQYIIKFTWADAEGAYITDGTTTTELISGYTLVSGLNCFNKTSGVWRAGGALLIGSSSRREIYNLTATVSDTEGTVSSKYVTKVTGGSGGTITNPLTIGTNAQIGYGKPTQIGDMTSSVFQEDGVFISQGGNESSGIHCDGSRINIWCPGDDDYIHVYDEYNENKCIAKLDANGAWNRAVTADMITGFTSNSTSMTWGNQTGTTIRVMNDSTGGSLGFRRDNPSAGQCSMVIDGTVYVDAGRYKVINSNNIYVSGGILYINV